MEKWGRGRRRFLPFFIDRLGLNLDEIAFANLAWCATKENRYPPKMLRHCFEKHTVRLLQILNPTVVLASGSRVHSFKLRIREELPGVEVITTLHYAHRKNQAAEDEELGRVKAQLDSLRRNKP